MIIITDIKVIQTDRDIFHLQRMTEPMCRDVNPESYEESTITREMIEGRRFVNPRIGEDIVIGFSGDVQSALQMPFDAFENLMQRVSKDNYQLIEEIRILRNDIKALNREITTLNSEIRTCREMIKNGEEVIREFENMSVLGFIKYKVYKWYNKLTPD